MDCFSSGDKSIEITGIALNSHEASWVEERAASSDSDASMAASSHGSSTESIIEANILATSLDNTKEVSPEISSPSIQSSDSLSSSPKLSHQYKDDEVSPQSEKTETEVEQTSGLPNEEEKEELGQKLGPVNLKITTSPIPYLVEARDDDVFHSPAPRRRLLPTVTAPYGPPKLPLYPSEPILSTSTLINPVYQHQGWKNQHRADMTAVSGHLGHAYSAVSQTVYGRHPNWIAQSLKNGQARGRSQSETNWQYRQHSANQTIRDGCFSSACSLGSCSESSRPSSTSSQSHLDGNQTRQQPGKSSSFENLAEALANESGDGPAPLYRRFQVLNHRVLLHLQDEISMMERVLIERDEGIREFSQRNPKGSDSFHESASYQTCGSPEDELFAQIQMRTELLGRIFIKLGQYNQALSSYSAAAGQYCSADESEVSAFRKWVSQDEAAQDIERFRFLEKESDLINLARPLSNLPLRSTAGSRTSNPERYLKADAERLSRGHINESNAVKKHTWSTFSSEKIGSQGLVLTILSFSVGVFGPMLLEKTPFHGLNVILIVISVMGFSFFFCRLLI